MKGLCLALFVAILAFTARASGFDTAGVAATTGTIEHAFTPGDDAAGLIVRTIDAARTQVLVQAFSFTHRDIADALIRAHRRGLDVRVIADREQSDSLESTAMQSLIDAGVPLLLDAEHSAAHNKVVVIDSGTRRPVVITGSFNFTFAAQYRNAENVLVLRGNPELAQAFFGNWMRHREHSVVAGRKHSK